MKAIYTAAVLAFLLMPNASEAQFFGPADYDECILESMEGVTSDMAARAIIVSCRTKFPEERETDPRQSLNSEQLRKVTIVDGNWPYGQIELHVHNGNDICIDSLLYRLKVWKESDPSSIREIDITFDNVYGLPIMALEVNTVTSSAGNRGEGYKWNVSLLSGFERACP